MSLVVCLPRAESRAAAPAACGWPYLAVSWPHASTVPRAPARWRAYWRGPAGPVCRFRSAVDADCPHQPAPANSETCAPSADGTACLAPPTPPCSRRPSACPWEGGRPAGLRPSRPGKCRRGERRKRAAFRQACPWRQRTPARRWLGATWPDPRCSGAPAGDWLPAGPGTCPTVAARGGAPAGQRGVPAAAAVVDSSSSEEKSTEWKQVSNKPINQSINRTNNQSNSQSINQSINQ